MKTWIIMATLVAIIVVGGVFVAASIDKPIENAQITPTTCSADQGCAIGGCTANNNCGLSTCGATTNGACGCGK